MNSAKETLQSTLENTNSVSGSLTRQLKGTMLNQWSLLHTESTVQSFDFASLACCFSPFMLFSCGCQKVAAVPDVMLKAGKKWNMDCVKYMQPHRRKSKVFPEIPWISPRLICLTYSLITSSCKGGCVHTSPKQNQYSISKKERVLRKQLTMSDMSPFTLHSF